MSAARIHFRPEGKMLDEIDYHRAELKDAAEKVAQLLEAKLSLKHDKPLIRRIDTLRKISAVANRIAEDIHNDIRREHDERGKR